MMKKLLVLGLLVATQCVAKIRTPNISRLNVDFTKALGPQEIKWGKRYKDDQQWCAQLAKRYQESCPSIMPASPVAKIPKIIHQIWLGSRFPERFERHVRTWKAAHPEWEYVLWDDAAIAELGLENQEAYDVSKNFGQKSDIARYEILYRFGGLYVDVDFECVMPFDELLYRYTFFAGISNGVKDFEINNAIIAAVAGHSVLRACIDHLSLETKYTDTIRKVIHTTGPVYFTREIMALEEQLDDECIIFPSTYFYPLAMDSKSTPRREYLKHESFAVHHWASSWVNACHASKNKQVPEA